MELLVLNTDFESIAVIDTYESMIWTDRYNSYGDFEIFFAMDTQLLQYLKEDYIQLIFTPIICRDNVTGCLICPHYLPALPSTFRIYSKIIAKI